MAASVGDAVTIDSAYGFADGIFLAAGAANASYYVKAIATNPNLDANSNVMPYRVAGGQINQLVPLDSLGNAIESLPAFWLEDDYCIAVGP
jgi:hypothetical protein